MEKSTISALIVAGGTALAAVSQVLVLRAAKKRKEQEAKTKDKDGSPGKEPKKT
jgi:hypothetical protein